MLAVIFTHFVSLIFVLKKYKPQYMMINHTSVISIHFPIFPIIGNIVPIRTKTRYVPIIPNKKLA